MSNSIAHHHLRVLLVDDEPDLRAVLAEALREAGHAVTTAGDGAEALARVHDEVFDVVVTDVNLPKIDGLTLFRRARVESPSTSVILITAFGEISQAVAALKEGVFDYLAKPFETDELLARLAHLSSERGLRRELEQARAALAGGAPEMLLVGQSPPMRRVLDMVRMVGRSEAPVLVTGESGTGKELVARMLHDGSSRRDKPYLAVNCSALTETLMEAELFGHERGAFTGAERKREGRFKAADGGTLFLDEVAELPLSAQAKLLRVLQEGTFEPLGSNATINVDVRVVSATHQNLMERVRQNLFREDLYYRINVIEIALPPLRERAGDLTLLLQHFLQRFTPAGTQVPALEPAVWAALVGYAWPGNVRELSHAIQRAVVLAGGSEIRLEHLPPTVVPQATGAEIGEPGPPRPREVRPLATAIREFEREYLIGALEEVNWKRTAAASRLNISRKCLWEKMRAHHIDDVDNGAAGTGPVFSPT
jgi:DNA-binding NtrC family response regulator